MKAARNFLGKALVLGAFALATTGCSLGLGNPNYGCDGYPEGVNCLSAREVYDLTEFQDSLQAGGLASRTTKPGLSMQTAPQVQRQDEIAQRFLQRGDSVPLRTPAHIMRISVFSWEDSDGSLHMGDTIYTEVERRKWMVGEKAPAPSVTLRPLDVQHRSIGDKTPRVGEDDFSRFQSLIPTINQEKE